jgi:hypothetical protein
MKHLILVVALMLLAVPAMAQITFMWDLSTDDAILGTTGGYKLYQSKTSGTYGATAAATVLRGINTVTIAKPGLGRYYWVVTAFTVDSESDHSNEVTTVLRPAKPTNHRITTIIAAIGSAIRDLFASNKKNLRITEEQ